MYGTGLGAIFQTDYVTFETSCPSSPPPPKNPPKTNPPPKRQEQKQKKTNKTKQNHLGNLAYWRHSVNVFSFELEDSASNMADSAFKATGDFI